MGFLGLGNIKTKLFNFEWKKNCQYIFGKLFNKYKNRFLRKKLECVNIYQFKIVQHKDSYICDILVFSMYWLKLDLDYYITINYFVSINNTLDDLEYWMFSTYYILFL